MRNMEPVELTQELDDLAAEVAATVQAFEQEDAVLVCRHFPLLFLHWLSLAIPVIIAVL